MSCCICCFFCWVKSMSVQGISGNSRHPFSCLIWRILEFEVFVCPFKVEMPIVIAFHINAAYWWKMWNSAQLGNSLFPSVVFFFYKKKKNFIFIWSFVSSLIDDILCFVIMKFIYYWFIFCSLTINYLGTVFLDTYMILVQ